MTKIQESKNSGVLIREANETDWMAGAIGFQEICNDWTPYLPSGERQIFRFFDSMACVTFSVLNSIETQLNFRIKTGQMSVGSLQWLNAQGYLENGMVELSDRFTAKMSGTTHQGNYFGNVWDSIRNHGVIPEKDWPASQDFVWETYYAEIPQNLKDKGQEFLKRFNTQYEIVINNGTQTNPVLNTKQAPIQIATMVCGDWGEKTHGCGCGSQHATMLYKDNKIFDSYDPYNKELIDYCIPWAYRGVIVEKKALSQEEIEAGLKRVLSEPIPEFNPQFGVGYPGGRVEWALAHRRNIFNLYIQYFQRIALPWEVDYWLRVAPDITTIEKGFKQSDEYKSKL